MRVWVVTMKVAMKESERVVERKRMMVKRPEKREERPETNRDNTREPEMLVMKIRR